MEDPFQPEYNARRWMWAVIFQMAVASYKLESLRFLALPSELSIGRMRAFEDKFLLLWYVIRQDKSMSSHIYTTLLQPQLATSYRGGRLARLG